MTDGSVVLVYWCLVTAPVPVAGDVFSFLSSFLRSLRCRCYRYYTVSKEYKRRRGSGVTRVRYTVVVLKFIRSIL